MIQDAHFEEDPTKPYSQEAPSTRQEMARLMDRSDQAQDCDASFDEMRDDLVCPRTEPAITRDSIIAGKDTDADSVDVSEDGSTEASPRRERGDEESVNTDNSNFIGLCANERHDSADENTLSSELWHSKECVEIKFRNTLHLEDGDVSIELNTPSPCSEEQHPRETVILKDGINQDATFYKAEQEGDESSSEIDVVCSVDPFDDILVFTTSMDYDLDQKEIHEAKQSIQSRLPKAPICGAPTDEKAGNTDVSTMTLEETTESRIATRLSEECVEVEFRNTLHLEDGDVSIELNTPSPCSEEQHPRETVILKDGINQDATFYKAEQEGDESSSEIDVVCSVDPFDDILVFTTSMDYDLDQKEIHEAKQSIQSRLPKAPICGAPTDEKAGNTDVSTRTWAETSQSAIASIVGIVAETLFLNCGEEETKTNCDKEPAQETLKLSSSLQKCLDQPETESQEILLPDFKPLTWDWRAIAVPDPDSLLKQQQPLCSHQETGSQPESLAFKDSRRQLPKLEIQAVTSVGSEIENNQSHPINQPPDKPSVNDSSQQFPILQIQAATSEIKDDDKYEPADDHLATQVAAWQKLPVRQHEAVSLDAVYPREFRAISPMSSMRSGDGNAIMDASAKTQTTSSTGGMTKLVSPVSGESGSTEETYSTEETDSTGLTTKRLEIV